MRSIKFHNARRALFHICRKANISLLNVGTWSEAGAAAETPQSRFARQLPLQGSLSRAGIAAVFRGAPTDIPKYRRRGDLFCPSVILRSAATKNPMNRRPKPQNTGSFAGAQDDRGRFIAMLLPGPERIFTCSGLLLFRLRGGHGLFSFCRTREGGPHRPPRLRRR